MVQLDKPVNAQERYLYGISERLDVIIQLLTPQLVTSTQEIRTVVPDINVGSKKRTPKKEVK